MQSILLTILTKDQYKTYLVDNNYGSKRREKHAEKNKTEIDETKYQNIKVTDDMKVKAMKLWHGIFFVKEKIGLLP